MNSIHFAQPYYLYLLLLVPFLVAWYWLRNRRNNAEIQISTTASLANAKKTFKEQFRHGLFTLRTLAIILLIIVLARPQTSLSRQDVTIEGIDIMLAVDISSSMLAEDFKPNRVEAAKKVAAEFIDGRQGDRIGLVIFSGQSFTQCPLTTDHTELKNLFNKVKIGMIEDGTAIGNGLGTCVSRLKESKAISKVIIATNGVNNRGEIDPLTAGEIAKLYGIRVYAIGVGTTGMAPYPVQTPFGVQYQNMPVEEIDEALLKKIANETDGKYFRATDNAKLRDIYKEIDKMEKSKIDVTVFRKKKEEFLIFALIAACLLVAEFILKTTVFRTIP